MSPARLTFRSHLVVSCIPVLELKLDRLGYSRLLWYAGKLHLPTNRWINCELIWQLRDLALVLFAAVRNVQPRSTIRKHRSQMCRGLLYRKRFMRSKFRQTTDTHSSIRHKSSPPLDTNSSKTNSLDKRFSTNAPVIALGHEQRRSNVSDMFAGCAIGCCSLRQARENALVSGTFFTLLQIARRELYLANHKTWSC